MKLCDEHEFGNGVAIFTRDGDCGQVECIATGRCRLHGAKPIDDAGGTPVGVQGVKPPVAEGEIHGSISSAVGTMAYPSFRA